MEIDTSYKNKKKVIRLADIYWINLEIFYWDEKDFYKLIEEKVELKNKQVEEKRKIDDAKTFWQAISEVYN